MTPRTASRSTAATTTTTTTVTATTVSIIVCALLIVAVWWWRLSAVEVPVNAPQLADEVFLVTRDRLLAATVIGLSLGAAGVLLRTATQNPLADPEITGVNSGAAFGAVAATTASSSVSGAAVLPGALVGATLAAIVTVGLGLRTRTGDASGAASVQRMILLGIAVSALFSALTSITLVLDEAQLSTVLSWLSGRLAGVRIAEVVPSMITLVIALPLSLLTARALDLLAAGDATAAAVGARPRVLRVFAVTMAVLLVAPAVAAVGPIGFLGLLSAVVAHRIAGQHHRLSLLLAPMVGAVVLLLADAVAQRLWAPAETPVGVVTALLGVPLLLWGINRLQPVRHGSIRRAARRETVREETN